MAFQQRSQLHKLTCKKLSTEANSHIDRIVHRGNRDGGGGPTSCVTILLHCSFCCGDSSCRCSFFFGLAASDGAAAAWSRAAARIVHARDGRLLLLTGGVGVVAAVSFWTIGASLRELWLGVWFPGEQDRSLGIGEGEEASRVMVVGEIRRVRRSYSGITCRRGSWVCIRRAKREGFLVVFDNEGQEMAEGKEERERAGGDGRTKGPNHHSNRFKNVLSMRPLWELISLWIGNQGRGENGERESRGTEEEPRCAIFGFQTLENWDFLLSLFQRCKEIYVLYFLSEGLFINLSMWKI